MSDLLKILFAAVLIALNGFFVSAEFAMIRVRRTRVEQLASEGSNASKVVLQILGRLDLFLAATQLGITIVTLTLGAFAEPLAQHLIGPTLVRLHLHSVSLITTISYVVALVVITIAEVVFGELLPKWSVLDNPERAANFVAYPMDLFVRLFYPLILFLRWLAGIFAKMIGLNPANIGAIESAHSEDEIIAIVEQAEQEGTIGTNEAEIVDAAFEFARTQAHEIMTPRVDIIALESDWPLDKSLSVAMESGLTRLPVYEDDKDHIIGVVHIKDLTRLAQTPDADIHSIVRDAPVVPETKRIDELLKEMQRSKCHMAVVMDEYGGTAGLVTIEDIVEELVGEIQDEYDRPPPIERLDDGCILIAGTEPLTALKDELGMDVASDGEYETVGGFARHVLGLSATPGARIVFGNHKITVTEAHGHRIQRMMLEPLPAPEEVDKPDVGT